VVRRQVDAGVDFIDDGEMGKSNWISYLYERTKGLQPRPAGANLAEFMPPSRDRQHFPGAYAMQDALDAASTAASTATAGGGERGPAAGGMVLWSCTGPMSYDKAALDRDVANFRAALADAGVTPGQDGTEVFLPVVAPASAYWLKNEYYETDEEFVYAIADVLHEEYKGIIDAGFVLQVDDAVLMHEADSMLSLGKTWADYRAWAELRVEALNHALRGLPEDRVRYHVCFGSWHVPHVADAPLEALVDLILQVNAGAYSIEAANPRHEWEWEVWERAKLPDGKILIPGVVTHSTNLIEHPELVAERITRYADRLGRENVMAGADCGFGSRIHPELGWAKLAVLAEGAALASDRIWHR
jgi:5-methyltetrahydropteroyltriglutamate--homocysteine methyltransferase